MTRVVRAALLVVALGVAAAPAVAQPSALGQWASIPNLSTVPRHMMMLPTGQVLFFAEDDAALWDPGSGVQTRLDAAGYNIFCSGHVFLPDGRLLVTGGHVSSNVGKSEASVFDPFTRGWTALPRMNDGRWYPTNTRLPTGDVLVVSGDIDTTVGANRLPQVWERARGQWRDLTSAQLALDLYPHMHVAPNGKIFNAGPSITTRYLDPTGTGAWSPVATRGSVYRDYGSSVMYSPGKVLYVGGGDPPTGESMVIDLNAGAPAWRSVPSMGTARRQLNATVLPDGTVLVTGGTSGAGFNNAGTPVFAAELWDPTGERWTTLASASIPRLYHSTAVLLPDGRVLTGGGDGYTQAEVFSPPYLLQGARPTVTAAPPSVGYGRTLFVQTPDVASIRRVTLVGLSAATHGFNQNQRFMELTFSATTGGLNVIAPESGNLAPPGYYMLFVLNEAGVPSLGKMVQVGPDTGGFTLTALAPDHAAAGGPSFSLTTRGAGFTPGSIVRWNGADRPTTFVGPTQLDATVSATDIVTAGTAAITVGDPGVPAPSNPLTFTIDGTGQSLVVIQKGTGNGRVTSVPAGIDCGTDCSESYAGGALVTLTAVPDAGAVFAGWSGGGCAGTGTCTVTLSGTTTVTATFTSTPGGPYALAVTKTGTGGGAVTSAPGGINCGTACSHSYAAGTGVTLTATPAPNSVFGGWAGACSGTGGCQLTLGGDAAVTATFTLATGPPAFRVSGTSATPNVVTRGTSTTITTSVTNTGGAAAGILIDFEIYSASGARIYLQATSGQSFAAGETRTFQWVWPVPGTLAAGTYTIKFGVFSSGWATLYTWVNDAGAIVVSTGTSYTLTASTTGSGAVTSTPSGLDCGADCSEAYAAGTAVTLTATPAAGSVFTGWSGACTGTGSCAVTMSANRSVTATFAAQVTGAPRFTVEATSASPSPVSRGTGTTISMTVTDVGGPATGVFVDLEVYTVSGARVYQQITGGQSFQSGQRRTFQWTWPIPGTLAAGTYIIKFGFFSSDWTTLYTWNNGAGSVTVTAP